MLEIVLPLSTPVATISREPLIKPGLYTNEEEVSFDREQGRTPPPWIGAVIEPRTEVRFVDQFGRPATPPSYAVIGPVAEGRGQIGLLNGGAPRLSQLRRARPATCWGASLKVAKKPDGSDDWYGARGLKLHDQGGRVSFGGGDTGAPQATLRMRNVVWPAGSANRPSLVLYVHTPEGGERAVSYAWADPGAKRIGINLRWMQASCTIDDFGDGTE